jgi:hypothetical protein
LYQPFLSHQLRLPNQLRPLLQSHRLYQRFLSHQLRLPNQLRP